MERDPAVPMENRAFKSSVQRTRKPIAQITASKEKKYTLLIFCTMCDLTGADQDLDVTRENTTQKSTFLELPANCSKQQGEVFGRKH